MSKRSINSACAPKQRDQMFSKTHRHANRMPAIRIDIPRCETRLSSKDELECQQIYEKLQRLQPNGVCANLNTLRRALYPPSSLPSDLILSFKTYRQCTDEMPHVRRDNRPKQIRIKHMNRDQVVNQMQKHAAINYSYYTRAK